MIILLQNILFLKELLACNGCFGLFTKIKKWSGTSFWWTFSAWFCHESIPYEIIYQLTKFQCHLFSSQDLKQNVLLSSYLYNWCYHKLWNPSSIILSVVIHKFNLPFILAFRCHIGNSLPSPHYDLTKIIWHT